MNLLILASVPVLIFFLVKRLLSSRRQFPLPPGPQGWPIIGNLFDMPRETTWLTFTEWGKKYGKISSVTVFNQPIIVINSVDVAQDLLGKKGNIYSDRPQLPMGGELIGWKNALPLLRYGDSFHQYRRLLHQSFGTHTAMKAFHEFESTSVQKFLRNVVASPHELVSHLKTHIGTVVLGINYGYDVTRRDDHFINLLDTGMKQFAVATAPGAFLVDVLPILRYVPPWFPGGGFHAQAKIWAKSLHDMVYSPYAYAKTEIESGTAKRSFASTVLDAEKNTADEHIIRWTVGTIAAGGFSTRLSFLQVFFLTMSLNPEVQRKAQEEIDTVVGHGRFPTFADRDNLPYVNALCREIFRFHAVVPTGLPHVVTEDDVYDGLFIPKGSILFVNIWDTLHDPDIYAEPEVFNPSRFISSDGHAAERDIYDFVFGFGRRICPGRILADVSLFMMAAMSLSVLDISKLVKKDGTVVEPVLKPLSGSVSQPTPFQCSIKVRSQEALSLLMSDAE